MATFIITLIIITTVLLILITALQNSKKEGTGNILGNAGVYQIIGVKKTSDLLERITWVLIILLFSLSFLHSIVLKKRYPISGVSPNLERFQGENMTQERLPNNVDNQKENNPDSAVNQ